MYVSFRSNFSEIPQLKEIYVRNVLLYCFPELHQQFDNEVRGSLVSNLQFIMINVSVHCIFLLVFR